MDLGFPVIYYPKDQTPLEWGQKHGESYREAIHEVAEIRKNLMFKRNSTLSGNKLEELALAQWLETKNFSASLHSELEGIREGAKISITDLVILNNYTDFRDIYLEEEGCSVVTIRNQNSFLSGQTWDMHSSARDYLCVIEVEGPKKQIILSLVGCPGLSGYSARKNAVCITNLNTTDAAPGIIWPSLVREMLKKENISEMRSTLQSAKVTSAHSYTISSKPDAELWELTPSKQEKIADLNSANFFYQTNHCRAEETKNIEATKYLSSTTNERFSLLEKKVPEVHDLNQMLELFDDREGFPISICSRYQSSSVDPSFTCGGCAADLSSGKAFFWRGTKGLDSNYKIREFKLYE